MSLTRRNFLESAALAPLVKQALAFETDPKTGMPLRALGKTGFKVSLLAFGAGSRWLAYKTPDQALPALELALKSGVNYVDSAATYGDGQSESWIGEFLKTHKKDFFLVTKITPRKGDEAQRQIERSMKNFGIAQVDLMHIHSLGNDGDLAEVEAKGNILDVVQQMKEQKVARFIGVTSHTNPKVMAEFLTRHDLDSCQMALNIARIGNSAPSNTPGRGMSGPTGFEMVAMPVALRKQMGLTAMKVFAQERLLGTAAPEILVRYAMTLPVAATTIGMPKMEYIEANVRTAKNFKPLTKEEMNELPTRVTGQMRAAIEHFFSDHVDC
jgi:predicted aldo/keto reductase-like oxidoreductase